MQERNEIELEMLLIKKQIEFEDDLLRQSKDIIALTAGLEGL